MVSDCKTEVNKDEVQVGTEASKIPIDIMVPAHEHLELTIKCINSIYQNTKTPFHLIVVDNSKDLTPLYLRQLQKEHNNVTVHHEDRDWTGGNEFFNIALSYCKTPYMATVMNSMTVEPDWEDVALQLMENQPKIGVIGFKCLFPWGLIESAGIALAGYTPIDIGRDLPGHRLTRVYDCIAVQWAFALLRVEAVKGLLDGVLFNAWKGWDDIDNSFVVRNAGWKIVYDGLGVGYHLPRASRGDNSEQAKWLNLQNAQLFYKRWGFWDAFKKAEPTMPELVTGINGKVAKYPLTFKDEKLVSIGDRIVG